MTTQTDQEFVNVVSELASSLASNIYSDSQQQTFFRLAELPVKRLPHGAGQVVAENFLAVTISIISLKKQKTFSIKAIKVLHTFLRYDESVFQVFRPNKPLLRKMNLEEHIMSTNPSEVEAALDLAQFLLRYHRAVDYGDFSENPYVVQRIRRYHDYKIWFEIEEISGMQEDLSGNFGDFKGVTQKALQEIVAHLERSSAESEHKIKAEAASLAKRVNGDIAALNEQISSYRVQRDGLQSENYKKLLDLLMQLDAKMKQTNSNLMGDLRKEFETMIGVSEQSGEGKLKVQDDRIKGKLQSIEGRMTNTEASDQVRGELEKIIADRFQRSDANFKKLAEALRDLENKSDASLSKQISTLRSQIEVTQADRVRGVETEMTAQQQKVMDLVRGLEGRIVTLVKDFMGEIQKSGQASKAMLDANIEHILKLIDEQSTSKTSALSESIAKLRTEMQKLVTDRIRLLEQQTQQNTDKTMVMIDELQRKLDGRFQTALHEQNRNHDRDIEETKEGAAKQLQGLAQSIQSSLVDLEKLAIDRGDEINKETRREIGAIIEDRISKQNELSQENYKKTLQLLLELEKRLDEKQHGMLLVLRQEFTKAVTQLDNSNQVRELEESFNRKITGMQEAIEDQSRDLTTTFEGLIRQADQQIHKALYDAIKTNEQELEGRFDDKIHDNIGKIKRMVEDEVKKSKQSLTIQLEEAIDNQKQGLQGMIKSSVDESRATTDRKIDKFTDEINSNMLESIDKRIEESQESIVRIIDDKILSALQINTTVLGQRWSQKLVDQQDRTTKALEELSLNSKKQLDLRYIQLQGETKDMLSDQMREMNQVVLNTVTDKNEEQSRIIRREIEQTVADLSKDSGSTEELFKAQVERIRAQVEQFQVQLDKLSSTSDGKMTDVTIAMEQLIKDKVGENRRHFDKQIKDSQTSLQSQLRGTINDHFQERIRVWGKQNDARQHSSLQQELSKYNVGIEAYTQQYSKGETEKMSKHTMREIQISESKMSDLLSSAVQKTIDDSNDKDSLVHQRITNIQKLAMKEVVDYMQNFTGQSGNSAATEQSLNSIKTNFSAIMERHESQLNHVQGRVKALDSEIEGMIDIKISNQMRIMKTTLNERLQQIGQDLQQMTRESIKELTDKVQRFDEQIHQLSVNSDTNISKLEHIEVTLSQQVDMIQGLNDKLSLQVERMDGLLKGVQKVVQELQAEFLVVLNDRNKSTGLPTNRVDELSKIVALLQKNDAQQGMDIKFLRERIQTELEAKLSLILRNRDDLLKRVEEIEQENEKLATHTEKRILKMETYVESGLTSQNDNIKSLVQFEQETRTTLDVSIRDLKSNDLKLQQEINDLNDRNREQVNSVENFKHWVSEELKSEFASINKNFLAQAQVLDGKEQRLQGEIDRMKDLATQQLEKYKELLGNVKPSVEYDDSLVKQLDSISQHQQETIQKLNEKLKDLRNRFGNFQSMFDRVKDIDDRLAKFNEYLSFFTKFIEEQAVDKIKLLRSKNDNPVAMKLEGMEWMARYMDFTSTNSIQQAIREYKKEFMTGAPGPERQALAVLKGHHTEGVATIVSQLRNLKDKMEQAPSEIDVHAYDLSNSMQCSLLECILLNNQNVNQLVTLRGIADVARIIQEQPMPSELEGEDFEYNDNYVNRSFKPALKCIMQSMRDEKAILEFMAVNEWMERILHIAEEFVDEEVTITILRTLKLIFKSDPAYDIFTQRYPSMGQFLTILIEAYPQSTPISFEAIQTLDGLLRRPHYIKLIAPSIVGKMQQMKQEPRFAPLVEALDRIIFKMKQR